MALTRPQFLDSFIRRASPKKVSRRIAMAKAHLERLPPGSRRTDLVHKLEAAERKVGKSHGAQADYRELKSIEAEAGQAAEQYLQSLSLNDITKRVAAFETAGKVFSNLVATVREGLRQLSAEVDRTARLSERLPKQESLSHEFDSPRRHALTLLRDTKAEETFAILHHDIQLFDPDTNPDCKALCERIIKASNAFKTSVDKYHSEETLHREFDRLQLDLEKLLRAKKDCTPEEFASIVDRREQAFELATIGQRTDAIADHRTLGLVTEHRREAKQFAHFDTKSFLVKAFSTVAPSYAPGTSDVVKRDCDAVGEAMRTYLQTAGVGEGDALFDAVLRSQDEWEFEIGASLGATDQETQGEGMRDAIAKLGQTVAATVQAHAPFRLSDDKGELIVGNTKYRKVRDLGAGGSGTVALFENREGHRIAVKSARGVDGSFTPEEREAMVMELRAHRRAMGDGGHDNVLRLYGVAVGPEGSLHALQEYADGGDMEDLGRSIQCATDGGIISDEARHALLQNFFSQAVLGMEYVQRQNMVHFDVKEANFFLSGNGIVKAADFGFAQTADDMDGKVAQAKGGTRHYVAPEIAGKRNITGKADTYSLGTMLANLTGGFMGQELGEWGKQKPVNQAVASLDRLRNALLNPDPDKRPTLEAVLESSYFKGAEGKKEDVRRLAECLMRYSQEARTMAVAVDRSIEQEFRQGVKPISGKLTLPELERMLVGYKADYTKLVERRWAPDATPEDREKIDQKLRETKDLLATIKASIAAIHDRDEIKPLVDKLRAAALAFGSARTVRPDSDGRTAPTSEEFQPSSLAPQKAREQVRRLLGQNRLDADAFQKWTSVGIQIAEIYDARLENGEKVSENEIEELRRKLEQFNKASDKLMERRRLVAQAASQLSREDHETLRAVHLFSHNSMCVLEDLKSAITAVGRSIGRASPKNIRPKGPAPKPPADVNH